LTKLIFRQLAFLILFSPFAGLCQDEFVPPAYDELLRETYKTTLKFNLKETARSTDGVYKKELKRFYKAKYQSSVYLADYYHFYFNEEWDNYIANISYKIAEANMAYDFGRIQTVISSYFQPNAYSIGEGTIVINPGIIPYIQNEDQLAFILCHEYAHYILNHAERQYIGILKELETGEFESQLSDISDSEFYQATQLKKLLRSKLYETRHNHRNLEIEADSLGLFFFQKRWVRRKRSTYDTSSTGRNYWENSIRPRYP
jgi:predicted Zn-dependent protease